MPMELPDLSPGEVLSSVTAALSGVVAAVRAHASMTFIDVDVTRCDDVAATTIALAGGSAVQLCVDSRRLSEDDGSLRALALLGVGDTVRTVGHPGRTRSGSAAAPSIFATSISIARIGSEPSRVLAAFDALRSGAWAAAEVAPLLGCEPGLLPALMPALGPALDAIGRSRQQPAAAPPSRLQHEAAAPPPRARPELLRRVASRRQAGLILVMEHISRPANAASMLRTCDALGIGTAAVVYAAGAPRLGAEPSALRAASASADLWVRLVEFESTDECARWLGERGCLSVGTAIPPADERGGDGDGTSGAPPPFHTLWPGSGERDAAHATECPLLEAPRLAVWVGSEASGLSAGALRRMDALLQVPMAGMVQSLNVSTCAALVLGEAVRRRACVRDAERRREYAPAEAELAEALSCLQAGNERL